MSNARILLVEDDPDDVHFMQRAFSKVCPTVSLEVIMDGQSVIDRLSDPGRPDRPEYVLLDLKLPKKPGLDVLEWIRGNPALAGLKVVILTSSKSETEVRRANKLGVDGYLLKPVLYSQLVELVRKICEDWSLENMNGPQS